jgi:hypothetical protein
VKAVAAKAAAARVVAVTRGWVRAAKEEAVRAVATARKEVARVAEVRPAMGRCSTGVL